jgi:hypothetical protein
VLGIASSGSRGLLLSLFDQISEAPQQPNPQRASAERLRGRAARRTIGCAGVAD